MISLLDFVNDSSGELVMKHEPIRAKSHCRGHRTWRSRVHPPGELLSVSRESPVRTPGGFRVRCQSSPLPMTPAVHPPTAAGTTVAFGDGRNGERRPVPFHRQEAPQRLEGGVRGQDQAVERRPYTSRPCRPQRPAVNEQPDDRLRRSFRNEQRTQLLHALVGDQAIVTDPLDEGRRGRRRPVVLRRLHVWPLRRDPRRGPPPWAWSRAAGE